MLAGPLRHYPRCCRWPFHHYHDADHDNDDGSDERGVRVTDGDLAEVVTALRSFGTDVANVEAKRARDALPRSVRDTLSSFSNTAGGVIVLGLDEEHGFVATGVAEPKRVADALASLAANEMEPPLRPLIALHQFEGAVLIVAEVSELDPSHKP